MRPDGLKPHIPTLRGKHAAHRAMTLLELLIVLSVIAILAAILFPVFASAREKARKTVCVSNMHQMGLSLRLYLDDFDQRFPAADPALNVTYLHNGFCLGLLDNQTSWVESIMPYVSRASSFSASGVTGSGFPSFSGSGSIPGVFYCPSDRRRFVNLDPTAPDPRKARTSYEYKKWLALGHSEAEVVSAAKMALLWERFDYHLGGAENESDRDGQINITLRDGHVRWVRLSQATTFYAGFAPDFHNFFPGMADGSHYGEDIVSP